MSLFLCSLLSPCLAYLNLLEDHPQKKKIALLRVIPALKYDSDIFSGIVPIGSMYGILMLTWMGYIDGIHGTPYIAAPWIRHGIFWHSICHQFFGIIPSAVNCLNIPCFGVDYWCCFIPYLVANYPLSKWVSSPQWFTWDKERVNPLKSLGWTNPEKRFVGSSPQSTSHHAFVWCLTWAIKNTPIPSHEILVGWKRFPNPMGPIIIPSKPGRIKSPNQLTRVFLMAHIFHGGMESH